MTWSEWERRQADLEELMTLGLGRFGKHYDMDWLDRNGEEFLDSIWNETDCE